MIDLVIGSNGFVGRHLVKKLLDRGDTVIGTYNNKPSEEKNDRFESVKLDITAPEQKVKDVIHNIATRKHLDSVYMVSAASHPKDPEEKTQAINVKGTEKVLNALSTLHGDKPRTTYVSTTAVYPASDRCWKEEDEFEPEPGASNYAKSKIEAEKSVIKAAEGGLPVNIIRCANSFGPGQTPNNLIPIILNKLLSFHNNPDTKNKFILDGGGVAKRDWVPVNEMACAIIKVNEEGKSGQIYNGSTGEEGEKVLKSVKSIKETVDHVGKAVLTQRLNYSEGEAEIFMANFVKPGAERPGQQLGAALFDNTKIKALGWNPFGDDKNEFNKAFERGVLKTFDSIPSPSP